MNATSVSSAVSPLDVVLPVLISKAYEYLQTLLPGFEAPLVDASPCLTCADSASSDAGDVQESVIQAKAEKVSLSTKALADAHRRV